MKALTPQGLTRRPNYIGLLNNLMTLIICESLREIGEMACVTSAWSSRGQTLKIVQIIASVIISVLSHACLLSERLFTSFKNRQLIKSAIYYSISLCHILVYFGRVTVMKFFSKIALTVYMRETHNYNNMSHGASLMFKVFTQ